MMKGFLALIVINAVFTLSAIAQGENSLPQEALDDSVKILKQGSEPRYLLKDKLTPGQYLEVINTKVQAKGVGESESLVKTESTMVSDISISKPDKDGVTEKVIKLQSIKSKSDISGKPVFYMTREQAEKEKKSEKTAASQPAGSVKQSNREIGIKLLLSTKIMKIGPDGQVLSVTVLDDKLKETDDEKLGKNRKNGFINSDMPAKPVGIGAKWIIIKQDKMPKVGKYEMETKAELVSTEQTDQGKAAVIKTTMTTPKMQVNDNSDISSLKLSGNSTLIVNLEKGYLQKATRTQIVECEGKYPFVSENTTVTTTTPVADSPKP